MTYYKCCKDRNNWKRDYGRRVEEGDFQIVCSVCGNDMEEDIDSYSLEDLEVVKCQ